MRGLPARTGTPTSTIDQLLARSNNCHVRKIFDKPEKKGSGKTRELAEQPAGYIVLSLLFFSNLTCRKNGSPSLKRSHDLSLSEADSWKLHAALEAARSPLCQEPKRTFRQGLPAVLSPGQPQPSLSPLCPSAWGAPEQTTLGLFRSIRLCHMRADMSMHRACTVPCSCGRGASTLPGVSSVSRASSSLSVCAGTGGKRCISQKTPDDSTAHQHCGKDAPAFPQHNAPT